MDVQLVGVVEQESIEAIHVFDKIVECPGGSCPMTSTAIADLGEEVYAITKVGTDDAGKKITREMENHGVRTNFVCLAEEEQTAVSILPVFTSGKRGCFVNLGTNNTFHGKVSYRDLRVEK